LTKKSTTPTTKKSCEICLSDFDTEVEEAYRLQLCGHKFCLTCLRTIINDSAENKEKIPILCPFEDCKKPVGLRDIRDITQPETLKTIYKLSYNNYVEKNAQQFGHCPTAGCDQIFSMKSGRGDKFECENCMGTFCKKCRNPFHDQLTCEEYTKKMATDKEIKGIIDNKNIKQCRQCRNAVEKTDGCNHMTCKCGAHFCWLCCAVFPDAHACYKHLADKHKDPQFAYAGRDDNEGFVHVFR